MKDTSIRVLIIEDSEDDLLLLVRELKKGGYNPVYERVETAAAMKKALKEKQWDIILCDYSLPKFNAPSAIALLKETNIDIPLIVVTGTIGEETAAECMRLGAQDYIMKDNKSRLCPAISRELEDAKVRNKEKQAEEKLRYQEKRFRSLAENSSDIIVVVNREGIITYENPAVERILGLKLEERIGAGLSENLHPDDMEHVTDSFNKLLGDKNTPAQKSEVRLRHRNGSWRNFEAVASHLVHDNVVESIIVNLHDITDRKRAEEALRKSEQSLASIYNTVGDVIFHLAVEPVEQFRFVSVNSAFLKVTGLSEEMVIGRTVNEIIPEPSLSMALGKYQQAITEHAVVSWEEISDYPTGRLTGVVSIAPVFDDNDTCTHLIGSVQDITERKRVEDELRKLASVVQFSSEFVNIVTPDEKMIFLNETGSKMLGIDPDKVGDYSIKDIMPEPFMTTVRQELIPTLLAGNNWEGELQYRNIRTGILTDVHAMTFTIKDSSTGKPIYLANVSRDITERKKAESLLKQSEAKYRLLADHVKDLVWLMDLSLKVTHISPSVEKLLGYTLEELIQLPLDKLLTATSLQTAMEFYSIEMPKALKAPAIYSLRRLLELECRCKDGTILWIECMFSFIRDENGKPLSIMGEGRDVTERKQIEYNLRASEINFRHSLDDSPLGVRIVTMEGETIYANRAILDMYGYDSIEELKKISLKERYTPESYAEFLLREEKRLRGELGPSEYEISIVRKNGEIRHLHVFRKEIFWNGKKQSQVIYQNITERRQAEEALKESEDKFRSIFENSSSAMAIIERDTAISMVNKEYCRISLYEEKDVIGMSWTKQIPPEDLKRLEEYNRERFINPNNVPSNYEFSFYRKDGEIRNALISVAVLPKAKEVVASFVDITERKQAEVKLQQTLDRLKKSVGTTIQVLGTASEVRDPYTAGHQKRVADLARTIATEMGLSQDKIEGIRMAGSIHDIGKLSIPSEILVKPTKLTNIEFSLIKEHSQIGYEMLKDVESPWPLAQIVYQHHERMNGSGYPRNLKGDEILLEARIMAVADVVEAMASHRPYRPTLGIGAALEEITKNKGILYDNTVADACLKLFREKGYQFT